MYKWQGDGQTQRVHGCTGGRVTAKANTARMYWQ